MNSFQNKRRKIDSEFSGHTFFVTPTTGFIAQYQSNQKLNQTLDNKQNKILEKLFEEVHNLSNQLNTQNILIQELHKKLNELEYELDYLKKPRNYQYKSDSIVPDYIS